MKVNPRVQREKQQWFLNLKNLSLPTCSNTAARNFHMQKQTINEKFWLLYLNNWDKVKCCPFKGQLISKCPYEQSVSSKIPTIGFLPWKFTTSRLVQNSLSSCKQNILSFCVTLEVVNFQSRNLRNIFIGILDETDFS